MDMKRGCKEAPSPYKREQSDNMEAVEAAETCS